MANFPMIRWCSSLVFSVGFVLVGATGGCGSGPGAGDDTDASTVEIALKKVPSNIHCVQIVATGSRVQAASFDVVPGGATSLTMPGISPGSVTLRARATDLAGRSQPLLPDWNRLGYGNNSVQQVRVQCI